MLAHTTKAGCHPILFFVHCCPIARAQVPSTLFGRSLGGCRLTREFRLTVANDKHGPRLPSCSLHCKSHTITSLRRTDYSWHCRTGIHHISVCSILAVRCCVFPLWHRCVVCPVTIQYEILSLLCFGTLTTPHRRNHGLPLACHCINHPGIGHQCTHKTTAIVVSSVRDVAQAMRKRLICLTCLRNAGGRKRTMASLASKYALVNEKVAGWASCIESAVCISSNHSMFSWPTNFTLLLAGADATSQPCMLCPRPHSVH